MLEIPELDGVASIGISLILGATAIFLARESKGLLIGEPAMPDVQRKLLAIAQADPVGAEGQRRPDRASRARIRSSPA